MLLKRGQQDFVGGKKEEKISSWMHEEEAINELNCSGKKKVDGGGKCSYVQSTVIRRG